MANAEVLNKPETGSNGTALAQVRTSSYSQEQIELIKNQIAKGVNNAELALFLQICDRTQLDPFVKQIYCVKRKEKRGDQYVDTMSVQTSVDGYRLVASRSPLYEGQDPAEWAKTCLACEGTGFAKDEKKVVVGKCKVCDGTAVTWTPVWIDRNPPVAARVTVYKKGSKPFVRVCRFEAYVQTYWDKEARKKVPTSFWERMGDVMIAKCAEVLAIKTAFPQETAGLSADEDLGVAPGAGGGEVIDVKPIKKLSPEEAKAIEDEDRAFVKALDVIFLGLGSPDVFMTELYEQVSPSDLDELAPGDARRILGGAALHRLDNDVGCLTACVKEIGAESFARDPITLRQFKVFAAKVAAKISELDAAKKKHPNSPNPLGAGPTGPGGGQTGSTGPTGPAQGEAPPTPPVAEGAKPDEGKGKGRGGRKKPETPPPAPEAPKADAPKAETKPEEKPAAPQPKEEPKPEAPKAEAPKPEVKAEAPKEEPKAPAPETPKPAEAPKPSAPVAANAETAKAIDELVKRVKPAEVAALRALFESTDLSKRIDNATKMSVTNAAFTRFNNVQAVQQSWSEAGVKVLKGYDPTIEELIKFAVAVQKRAPASA